MTADELLNKIRKTSKNRRPEVYACLLSNSSLQDEEIVCASWETGTPNLREIYSLFEEVGFEIVINSEKLECKAFSFDAAKILSVRYKFEEFHVALRLDIRDFNFWIERLEDSEL